jgi:polar amino acid transport system substrate-binding protein
LVGVEKGTGDPMMGFLRSRLGIAVVAAVLLAAAGGGAAWWFFRPPTMIDTLTALRARGKIMIGVRADAPPFSAMNDNKTFVGFEPDIGKAIAAAIGVQAQFVSVDYGNAIDYLKRNVVDFVILPHAEDKSDPAIKSIEPGYFASGFNAVSLRESGLTKWEDLKGQAVCGLRSNTAAEQIVSELGGNYIGFTDSNSAIQAVAADRCRAFVNDEMALSDVIDSDVDKRYALAFDTIDPAPWTIAVRAADASLAEFVTHEIVEYHRKGFLIAQAQVWGLKPNPYLDSMKQAYGQ